VLPVSEAVLRGDVYAWCFDKRFHVSPFMAMTHSYSWRFDEPGEDLRVHMDVLPSHPQAPMTQRQFDATLVLRRKPIDSRNLAAVLLHFPFMTLRIVLAIHWQALLLWFRGNPVHDHPDKRPSDP